MKTHREESFPLHTRGGNRSLQNAGLNVIGLALGQEIFSKKFIEPDTNLVRSFWPELLCLTLPASRGAVAKIYPLNGSRA